MAKKRRAPKKGAASGVQTKDLILEYDGVPAPDVVKALAKRGVTTTVQNVYSTRHREEKKQQNGKSARAKRAKKVLEARQAKPRTIKKRKITPEPAPKRFDIDAIEARAKMAELKARNQVYRDALEGAAEQG